MASDDPIADADAIAIENEIQELEAKIQAARRRLQAAKPGQPHESAQQLPVHIPPTISCEFKPALKIVK